MKEAFWGVLIVMLGLFGIVVINVFQKVTIRNDETYYLIKEVTPAAMYDAIDLTYYRLTGDIRIVEDKFVENYTRRFAESLTDRGNYYIYIEDVNEIPPKVSINVKTSITSLQGDTFGIANRIDGIIETKYKINDITDFLEITEEEWINRSNVNSGDKEEKNNCTITTYGSEEKECITGDTEFVEFESDTLKGKVCDEDSLKGVIKEVTYKVCECGKWKTYKDEVTSTVTKTSNEYIYTWNYKKEGELRSIDETTKKRVEIDKCTDSISIMVPKDLRETEPSSDNSNYEVCTNGGIRIPLGKEIVLHGGYNPEDSVNRDLTWRSNNTNVTLQSSNPFTTVGYSRGSITAKEIGSTIVKTTSTNNKEATCKVTVWDGSVDAVSCTNNSVEVGSSVTMGRSYEPYNATKTDFTWTSSNTSVATIDEKGNIKGVSEGTSTITITSSNKKIGTCTITVNKKPSGGGSTTTTKTGTCNYTYPNEAVSIATPKGDTYPIENITQSECSAKGGEYSASYGEKETCKCVRYNIFGRCVKKILCTTEKYKKNIGTCTIKAKNNIYNYKSVTYSGQKLKTVTTRICSNGQACSTTRVYCTGKRTSNVTNPNASWSYTISSTSTCTCSGTGNQYLS